MFKSNLNEISRERYKSNEQKSVLGHIELLYKSQETVIKLFNDYSLIASEAKYKRIDGEGIKTSTSKQVLQRLLIAFAQVKVKC